MATSTKTEKIETENTEAIETPKERIPESLLSSPILADICRKYLETFDEISSYNKEVLAERTDGWTNSKVLEQARKMARPEPGSKDKKNEDIYKVLVEYENMVDALNLARKTLMETTAKELGITLSSTSERDPVREEPLKEKRKFALNIGSQLSMIAGMTSDETSSAAVTEFLAANPLPAIGRDQAHNFTGDGKATPKYRVSLKVSKDGNVLLEEDGFSKTALALTKPVFGYARGEAPKSDKLRAAWESAGNTPENTVQSPVEFDDNGLHFVITKK